MFDPRTAALLRSAPDVPGLAAGDLPQALTRHYASLVSRRLRGADTTTAASEDPWPVDRIADVYEIVASLERDPELRRAAAFVAGTAQQIIARRIAQAPEAEQLSVDRDSVDASAAAVQRAAGPVGETNFGGTSFVVPKAASSNTARYSVPPAWHVPASPTRGWQRASAALICLDHAGVHN